jgi:maltose O-acetyltransferase
MAAVSTMRERMASGQLYLADDPELLAAQAHAQRLVTRYNSLQDVAADERQAVLRELLGDVGEGVMVMPSFRCDYGAHIRIGAHTFVNYDCIMLDPAAITIGSSCQIATRVQLLTATHPTEPDLRRRGWEYALPITIGDNVWLGGGVIVGPGVTIGDDTVVGAGSVVTRDLPAGVVAYGTPASARRSVTSDDGGA